MNNNVTAIKKQGNYSEITIMNCILCLLVMFIHVSSVAVSTINRDTFYYFLLVSATRSSAFVVQGFVFLSAFKLFCNDFPPKYVPFFLGKIKKIYVPYLVWNGIYYVNFVNNGYFPFSLLDFFKYCVNGTLSSPFYFVVFIMQFYMLAPLWWTIYSKLSPLFIIPISLAITLYSPSFIEKWYFIFFDKHLIYLDRFFPTYILYWTLGAYTAKYRNIILSLLNKSKVFITTIFASLSSINIWLFYDFTRFGNLSPYINFVLVCYCVSAIYFFLFVSQKIPLTKPIKLLAQITFPIYLNHCFFLFYVDELGRKLDFHMERTAYLYRVVALYFVTLTLNLLWLRMKNEIKLKKDNYQQRIEEY